MAMNFNFGFGKINRSKQESSNTAFSFEKFNFSSMFTAVKMTLIGFWLVVSKKLTNAASGSSSCLCPITSP